MEDKDDCEYLRETIPIIKRYQNIMTEEQIIIPDNVLLHKKPLTSDYLGNRKEITNELLEEIGDSSKEFHTSSKNKLGTDDPPSKQDIDTNEFYACVSKMTNLDHLINYHKQITKSIQDSKQINKSMESFYRDFFLKMVVNYIATDAPGMNSIGKVSDYNKKWQKICETQTMMNTGTPNL